LVVELQEGGPVSDMQFIIDSLVAHGYQGEAFEIKCVVEGLTMKDNATGKELSSNFKLAEPEPVGPAWKK
jgi:hypothetical protein